jgi:hypothetical protein
MSRILKETLVVDAAQDAVYKLELKCDMCDGSGEVNVPEKFIGETRRNPPSHYTCPKCSGEVSS